MTQPEPTAARAIADAERAADLRAHVPQVFLPIERVLDGDWMGHSQCRDDRRPAGVDAETFHPVGDSGPALARIELAQKVCAGCPVNQPCRVLRYALGASGVWGGVNYASSSDGVRHARKKCAVLRCTNGCRHGSPYCSIECEHKVKAGSIAGYELHQKNARELPLCQRCRSTRERYRSSLHTASVIRRATAANSSSPTVGLGPTEGNHRGH